MIIKNTNKKKIIPIFLPMKVSRIKGGRTDKKWNTLRFVNERTLPRWEKEYNVFSRVNYVYHLFIYSYLTYRCIKHTGNHIINLIDETNFLKDPIQKDIISVEAARECSLFEEYSNKNEKKVQDDIQKKAYIKIDLNKYISDLYDENKKGYFAFLCTLGNNFGNYRKHISYNIPLRIKNDCFIDMEQLLINDNKTDNKCKKALKRGIPKNKILKISLKVLIKNLVKCAHLEIEHFAKLLLLNDNIIARKILFIYDESHNKLRKVYKYITSKNIYNVKIFYDKYLVPIHKGYICAPVYLYVYDDGTKDLTPKPIMTEDTVCAVIEILKKFGADMSIIHGYIHPKF